MTKTKNKKVEKKIQWGIADYFNLYSARPILKSSVENILELVMPVDVYIQDPQALEQGTPPGGTTASSTKLKPIKMIYVPCEPELMDGPTSSRIAVVDYNADTGEIEKPAIWDVERGRFLDRRRAVLDSKNCDRPQFHQLNVWASVQNVLSTYEGAFFFGHSIPWGFEGNRILLVPHAGELENAFYSRSSKSIQFYYFTRGDKRIYTCLSYDIIAHETGHAILDGLRPNYMENSSVQTSAFHEFFADSTAVITALLDNELRAEVIQETQGDMSEENLISSLAEEFGLYTSGRSYLRKANNQTTMADVAHSRSPYDWSQVLTGTVYEILQKLLFIKRNTKEATGKYPTLKDAYSHVSKRLRRMAFQPLDYLPPVDVQFSDYANTILRADAIVDPLDEKGYRKAIKKVLKNRKIPYTDQENPPSVNFYTCDIEQMCRSRVDAYRFLHENRRPLCIPAEQDLIVFEPYQTCKMALDQKDAKLPREIVIQYMWREDVPLDGKEFGPFQGERASLLCGGTLVFDGRGNLLSWQRKPGAGSQKVIRGQMRAYCRDEQEQGMERIKTLKVYLRDSIASGEVNLDRQIQPGKTSGEKSPLQATYGTDGSLRFTTVPHLRHWKGK